MENEKFVTVQPFVDKQGNPEVPKNIKLTIKSIKQFKGLGRIVEMGKVLLSEKYYMFFNQGDELLYVKYPYRKNQILTVLVWNVSNQVILGYKFATTPPEIINPELITSEEEELLPKIITEIHNADITCKFTFTLQGKKKK